MSPISLSFFQFVLPEILVIDPTRFVSLMV